MQAQGRFRKVSVRIHADAKFRALSRPPANAQTLWFYLLTAPESMSIPGVISVSLEGLAKALRWTPLEVASKMTELETCGMASTDLEAGLIYLPRAIVHNKPASPNVVKAWASHWGEVPECPLKNQILASLRAQVETYGKAWVKAFEKAFGEGPSKAFADQVEESSLDPSTKALPESRERERERELEQEEEKDTNSLSSRKPSDPPPETSPSPTPEPPPPEEPQFAHPESVADLFGGPPPAKSRKDVPHGDILALYHEVLTDLPKVRFMTETRKTRIRQRWREDTKRQTLDWWRRYFTYVRDHCPFLMGQVEPRDGHRPFLANLDWLTNQSNMVKILERNYERRDPRGQDYRPT